MIIVRDLRASTGGVLESFEDGGDEVADSGFVVGVGLGVEAVCDDGANCHTFMSHQATHNCQRCALHFVIGDLATLEFKFLDSAVEIGVRKIKAYFSALRTVESHG